MFRIRAGISNGSVKTKLGYHWNDSAPSVLLLIKGVLCVIVQCVRIWRWQTLRFKITRHGRGSQSHLRHICLQRLGYAHPNLTAIWVLKRNILEIWRTWLQHKDCVRHIRDMGLMLCKSIINWTSANTTWLFKKSVKIHNSFIIVLRNQTLPHFEGNESNLVAQRNLRWICEGINLTNSPQENEEKKNLLPGAWSYTGHAF